MADRLTPAAHVDPASIHPRPGLEKSAPRPEVKTRMNQYWESAF